jgi:hypothetical protein
LGGQIKAENLALQNNFEQLIARRDDSKEYRSDTMGDDGFKLKVKNGNLRWVGGFAVSWQNDSDEEAYQAGAGACLVGLGPKQLGYGCGVLNYTEAAGRKQLGGLFGIGINTPIPDISVGVNPGIDLESGEFVLGGEISAGILFGINKDLSILPSFKILKPDLFSDVGGGGLFYGVQVAFVFGHLPDEPVPTDLESHR